MGASLATRTLFIFTAPLDYSEPTHMKQAEEDTSTERARAQGEVRGQSFRLARSNAHLR